MDSRIVGFGIGSGAGFAMTAYYGIPSVFVSMVSGFTGAAFAMAYDALHPPMTPPVVPQPKQKLHPKPVAFAPRIKVAREKFNAPLDELSASEEKPALSKKMDLATLKKNQEENRRLQVLAAERARDEKNSASIAERKAESERNRAARAAAEAAKAAAEAERLAEEKRIAEEKLKADRELQVLKEAELAARKSMRELKANEKAENRAKEKARAKARKKFNKEQNKLYQQEREQRKANRAGFFHSANTASSQQPVVNNSAQNPTSRDASRNAKTVSNVPSSSFGVSSYINSYGLPFQIGFSHTVIHDSVGYTSSPGKRF